MGVNELRVFLHVVCMFDLLTEVKFLLLVLIALHLYMLRRLVCPCGCFRRRTFVGKKLLWEYSYPLLLNDLLF